MGLELWLKTRLDERWQDGEQEAAAACGTVKLWGCVLAAFCAPRMPLGKNVGLADRRSRSMGASVPWRLEPGQHTRHGAARGILRRSAKPRAAFRASSLSLGKIVRIPDGEPRRLTELADTFASAL